MARMFAVAAAIVTLVALVTSGVHGYDDQLIRCKVCERSVSHVWHRSAELRSMCRAGVMDTRCDYTQPNPTAIDQIAWGVCDALPTSYHAIHDSEFDLVLGEGDPEHTDEAAETIKRSCIRWLHHQHGAEEVAGVVRGALEMGKTTDTALTGIRRQFCHKACGYQRVSKRVSHKHHHIHEEKRDEL
jgi:hypothetical protein